MKPASVLICHFEGNQRSKRTGEMNVRRKGSEEVRGITKEVPYENMLISNFQVHEAFPYTHCSLFETYSGYLNTQNYCTADTKYSIILIMDFFDSE